MTDDDLAGRPIPRATYRLQLHKEFTFRQAGELAPYLGQLGVSHAYLSPIVRARRGSSHGYDTVDHSVLNPELGTDADFEAMAAEFRTQGIGIILDIVPNHMGVGGDENAKWLDVLEWGQGSRYASWFDINWSPLEPSLKNKVLVPFLGSSFGEALESGAIELRHDPETGKFAVWIENTHKLPVCPDTFHLIGAPEHVARLNSPVGRSDLVRLIDAQFWRPARYSVAADDINYRRLFIVSDLAAIRVEQEHVFDEVHRLPFELVRAGLVDGLRVDHVDGLYDPKAYCLRVREQCPRPIYLIVEKILAPHEALRADWEVDGTTGYEFASSVMRLLTDPAGEAKLSRAYVEFTGHTHALARIERDAKRAIMDFEMAAELDGLAVRFRSLAASDPRTVDLTRNAIRIGLREMIACFPVYRTYLDDGPVHDDDRRNIALAVAAAREAVSAVDPAVFDFLRQVLTGELRGADQTRRSVDVIGVAGRFQQYTGPVMAKGLEDTALYRFNRLIALSDVGEKPDRFSTSVEAFHDFNLRRLRTTPNGMLTSSSHDTKRGEDTRARIAAISGFADEWILAVRQWFVLLEQAGAPKIDANDAYHFFQLLLGAWPTTLPIVTAAAPEREAFRSRIDAAMLKSVREARVRTNWNVPSPQYEQQVTAFVVKAFTPAFLESFAGFERLTATAGAKNGLIETVLKLTVPGVPDIYQGAEFWEQSMVDPDNRRPVDFDDRRAVIEGSADLTTLLGQWRTGGIKQHLIQKLLRFRSEHPLLFSCGSYEPLEVGSNTCGFDRRYEGLRMRVLVDLQPWRPRTSDANNVEAPEGMQNLLEPEAGRMSSRDLPAAVFVTL